MRRGRRRAHRGDHNSTVRLSFPGSNADTTIFGLDRLPGNSNYLVGNDPSRWHTDVPNYTRVKYAGLYPGVDLVYYGNHRELEFDFVVAPHVDVSTVRMNFDRKPASMQDTLSVDADGALVLGGSKVLLHKPVLYQMATVHGVPQRRQVNGEFVVDGPHSVRFRVGAYDRDRELVIDPTLDYATYVGGFGFVGLNGLAIDAKGDAFVAGFDEAEDGSGGDAYVDKLNSSGTALLYATDLRAPGILAPTALAVDAAGNAYIAGGSGPGLPTTSGAYQRTSVGTASFVAKLNVTGTALLYATYLNGPKDPSGRTAIRSLAIDAQGDAYVMGDTSSKDFPTTKGVLQPLPPLDNPYNGSGVDSIFLAKLNPSGSALVYSTFLGNDGYFPLAVAVDSADNAYVLGQVSLATDTHLSHGRGN